MSEYQIFCDFDGTITKEDTLNKFLHLFANEKWLEYEQNWINGKIGSKECTIEQMKLVPVLNENEMKEFVKGIDIEPSFFEFIEYVKSKNIDFYIVSDGFDFFIKTILEQNGIYDLKVFSNHLSIENGKYVCEFPYTNPECIAASGMCKCSIVKKYKNNKKSVIYVGDGVSDFCVSNNIKTVFAKGRLLEYCKKNKDADNGLMKFDSFIDVLNYLKK